MTIWIHWTFQNFTTMNSHMSGQMIFVLGTKRAMGTMVVFDSFVDQLMGNQTAFMSKLKCKQRADKKSHHVFSVIFLNKRASWRKIWKKNMFLGKAIFEDKESIIQNQYETWCRVDLALDHIFETKNNNSRLLPEGICRKSKVKNDKIKV